MTVRTKRPNPDQMLFENYQVLGWLVTQQRMNKAASQARSELMNVMNTAGPHGHVIRLSVSLN